uniref:J domain-containing protein n=1 Tax=Macrostomum lignano TaxID=282301 RepID=A0A1I8HRY0_9PLAT
MMSTCDLESERLRKEGNGLFFISKRLSRPEHKRKKLWTALDFYKAGLTAARVPKDRSLCLKNSAVAHKDLCILEWRRGALHQGLEPLSLLYDFNEPSYLEAAANIFMDYAGRLLRLSISLDKSVHYSRAVGFIAEMTFPIQEAEKLLFRNVNLLACMESELATLREDQRLQAAILRSRHDLAQGKGFLQNLCEDGAEKMVALSLVSDDGLDIVLEAEICSTIGNLYLNFFNAESSAERHLKRCVELVLCYLSNDLTGSRCMPWFAAAERGLRELQERRAKRRDEERLAELEAAGVLADLKANWERGSEHFLRHIYEKYPPRPVEGQPARTPPDASKPLKKQLMIALTHYHPDKVDKSDRRWYYTCEEITKYLNSFFEVTKG